MAGRLADDIEPYLLRKAALGLRKARRLRPEWVVRVADWGRQVATYSLSELRASPDKVLAQPGVYLFYDSTGYLYIGEAANLRQRLQQHLANSDRPSLADYLQQSDSSRTQNRGGRWSRERGRRSHD